MKRTWRTAGPMSPEEREVGQNRWIARFLRGWVPTRQVWTQCAVFIAERWAAICEALRVHGSPSERVPLRLTFAAMALALAVHSGAPRRVSFGEPCPGEAEHAAAAGHLKVAQPEPSPAVSIADKPPALPAALPSINDASREALIAVKGIGPKTAAKILAKREALKGFRRWGQVRQVKGIGASTLARLREHFAL